MALLKKENSQAQAMTGRHTEALGLTQSLSFSVHVSPALILVLGFGIDLKISENKID